MLRVGERWFSLFSLLFGFHLMGARREGGQQVFLQRGESQYCSDKTLRNQVSPRNLVSPPAN
jgi:hypothetical protein